MVPLQKVKPLISVIVPIYKVEKYLEHCIDSILAQEYKNLQIILVDDGSPDKCPEICESYAKRDPRITVIHKANGGLSDARNVGLGAVKGEYISFVDSDDYINKTFISSLYRLSRKYDADISICEYAEVFEASDEVQPRSNTKNETVLTNIEAIADSLVAHKYGHVYVWNKLYKTDVFKSNGIQFPKGKMHEDAYVIYKLFYYANRIAYTGLPLYNYLKRPIDVTGKIDSSARWQTKMNLLREMEVFIHDHNLPLSAELDACFLRINLHYIGIMADSNRFNKETWKGLRANIISKFPVCLFNVNLSPSQKFAATLACAGWVPYKSTNLMLRYIGYAKKPID